MVGFQDLPVEITRAILTHCSATDKLHACLASRTLYDKCISGLYSVIDLSTHNDDSSFDCNRVRFINSNSTQQRDRIVLRKQLQLTSLIRRRPEYGKHVQELCWTIGDVAGNTWGSPERPMTGAHEMVDGITSSIYEPEDEPLWEMFRSFVNVARVDLFWLREWREVTPAPCLFQSATSIRLGGAMTPEFVHSILSVHPRSFGARLRHLELCNLWQWSSIEPQLPQPAHLRDLMTWDRKHQYRLAVGDYVSMHRVLDPLAGIYSSLRSLRIMIHGQLYGSDDPEEVRKYVSLARLVCSVRHTLEDFYFEQGYNSFDPWPDPSPNPPITGRQQRPMDRYFSHHMLPMLLESSWPNVKKMEIRGVGSWTEHSIARHPPSLEEVTEPGKIFHIEYREDLQLFEIKITHNAFSMTTRAGLRSLLNDDATLIIEEQATRHYEYLGFPETGIPYRED